MELDSVEAAQVIIREDIEKTCEKLPQGSARFLNEKFSDSSKLRERLVNKTLNSLSRIENETIVNETDMKAHLKGCDEWLMELQSILSNNEQLYPGTRTTDEQICQLQVSVFIHPFHF